MTRNKASSLPALAAGDDRAFRRAFATALLGPNFLVLEGLKGILSAAGFRVVATASHVNDLNFGLEIQDEPILLIVNAGEDLRTAIKQIELFKERHETGRVVLLGRARSIRGDTGGVSRRGQRLSLHGAEP